METIDLAARRAAKIRPAPPLPPDLQIIATLAEIAHNLQLTLAYARTLEDRLDRVEHIIRLTDVLQTPHTPHPTPHTHRTPHAVDNPRLCTYVSAMDDAPACYLLSGCSEPMLPR